MRKTHIFFGNKYVDSMYCGKSRFSVFLSKTGIALKRATIVCGGLSVVGWSILSGSYFFPRIAYAEKEVVKEIIVNEKIPVMERIAKCESGNMHFKNGQVIINVNSNGSYDSGRYQINSIWNKKATELGLNLMVEKDNEAMARWIYVNRGTEDWYSSKSCWQK